MFGRAWQVGRIGGIPIRLDPSLLLLIGLLTYATWSTLEGAVPGGKALALAAFAAVSFVGTVLVHELAHAAAARLRRIEVKGVTLLMWGGFTETSGTWEKPGDEFVVSVVGPLSSLAIGGALYGITEGGLIGDPALAFVLHQTGVVNLFLGVFNLLPGFPLDGGRALRAVVWKVTGDEGRSMRIAAATGQVVGVLVIAYGLWQVTTFDNGYGLWTAMIGLMMFSSAGEVRRAAGRSLLAAGRAREVMGPPPPSIPQSISLSDALDRYLMGHEQETFPVVDDQGEITGVLTFGAARRVGQEDPLRPVRDAMLPVMAGPVAAPDDTLDRVWQRLGTRPTALVLDGGTVVGQVSRPDIERWLRSRAERP